MTYVANSPEVMLSDFYESTTAQRLIGEGWHVLHTAQVGDGATMVEGPEGKVVMPDLQLFDLIRGRNSRLVEVKAKTGAYPYKKLQIDCTGFDWPKWDAYRRMNDSGVPVDVAIIHLHWPLRHSPEIAPKLLWQTVSRLEERGPMRWTNPKAPHGMAVWDVKDFDLLGDMPNPPDDIVADLRQSGNCNLRVWEAPPQLRRPRLVPGQLDLFSAQPDEALVWTGKLFRGAQDGTVRGFIYNHRSGRRVEFTGTRDPRPAGGYLLVGNEVAV